MNTFPGTGLEEFLEWKWKLIPAGVVDVTSVEQKRQERHYREGCTQVTFNQFAPLVGLYEPWREMIEDNLGDFTGTDESTWLRYSDCVDTLVPELTHYQAREYIGMLKQHIARNPVRAPVSVLVAGGGKSNVMHQRLIELLKGLPDIVLVNSYEPPKNNLDELLRMHGDMYNELTHQVFGLDANVKIPRRERIPHRVRGDKRQFPIGRKK
jgi:hypothetical protein